MIYLYSYDVSSSRRRNKISRVLERYGCRIQKSVFQCDISAEDAAAIKKAVLRYLNNDEDSLLVYPICAKDAQKAEGYGTLPPEPCKSAAYVVL
jgi:CRISPR-associated protein Cas2